MATYLTEQQLARFQTFGFLAFPGLLGDRVERITQEFEAIWAANGGGHNGRAHDGSARSCSVQFIDQSAYLSTLLDDPRIQGIAASILGDDFNYMGSDGNYYVGDTQWHPDAGGMLPGYHLIKIALYLDPVRKDSGCLRVIPGSHREPFHSALRPLQQHRGETPVYPFGATGEQIPAYPLESDPGDVVLFNQALWHASFGGGNRRRMFTLNFTAAPKTEEEVGLHRKLYEGHLRHQQNNPYRQLDHVYEPGFLERAPTNR